MSELPDYRIGRVLLRSRATEILSGTAKATGETVLIKRHRVHPASNEALMQRREIDLIDKLGSSCLPHPRAWVDKKQICYAVFSELPGQPLEAILNAGPNGDTGRFLAMARAMTRALGEIHDAGMIHRGIEPFVYWWDEGRGKAYLIDLARATRARTSCDIPHLPGRDPRYLSPEQTGRMNRHVDFRTDFYSLGTVLYHLLVGRPPFVSEDHGELIHGHLARVPVAPAELIADLPEMVSALIMKLLAKSPDARYQSCKGLDEDLRICQEAWSAGGEIDRFPLGRADVTDRLMVSQDLFGRDAVLERLFSQLSHVRNGGKSLVMVTGPPGIGKTALVSELYRPLTASRGFFISGKFDQLERELPYAAIIEAFHELAHMLLSEPPDRLAEARAAIAKAVSPIGRVITEVVPRLTLLIDNQPPLAELPAKEARNRFNLVFRNFLGAVAGPDRPLVLFLDDLQWADPSTLELLESFARDRSLGHIMLIGAFREEEVLRDGAGPWLEALCADDVCYHRIDLEPLRERHLGEILAATLSTDPRETEALAEVCFRKTRGNPFFFKQFLHALHERELLVFDHAEMRWSWDPAGIEHAPITDNVIDLMVQKIDRLPERTRGALIHASCIGNRFDIATLSTVEAKAPIEVQQCLQPAIDEGLVVPALQPEDAGTLGYFFLHDRIQQAALSMCSEQDRRRIRHHVGKVMLDRYREGSAKVDLFSMVNHLNQGHEHLAGTEDRRTVAELNLKTGSKAISSLAYEAAANYLDAGLALLPENCWDQDYDLTLELHVRAIEAHCLAFHSGRVQPLIDRALTHATSLMDKIEIYDLAIQDLIRHYRTDALMKTGLEVLAMTGIVFPERPSPADLETALDTLLARLGTYSDEALSALPEMTEPIHLAQMKILSRLVPISFLITPNLTLLMIYQMVHLALEAGNTPLVTTAYPLLGTPIIAAHNDLDAAHRYGQLALRLMERYENGPHTGRVLFSIMTNLYPWKNHLSETIGPLREAYRAAIAAGDFEYAGYARYAQYQAMLLSGQTSLPKLTEEIDGVIGKLEHLGQEASLTALSVLAQTAVNLAGKQDHPERLSGNRFDFETRVAALHARKNRPQLQFVYFHRMMVAYYFGQHRQALADLRKAEANLDGFFTGMTMPVFQFFAALIRLANIPGAKPSARGDLASRVAANQVLMADWSKHAPMNNRHRFLIIEAERARVEGRDFESLELFDQAAREAGTNGYIQDQALACSLCARIWSAREAPDHAAMFLGKALDLYRRWGAEGIANSLETKMVAAGVLPPQQDTLTTQAGDSVDLGTLLKASQAISGEILLDRLLEKLVGIMIENAGAQRATFLLSDADDQLTVRARGDLDTIELFEEGQLSMWACEELPIGIVSWVSRTREWVVLDDATAEHRFVHDPYIQRRAPKSVLCTPILNQGKLVGLLYLENNLTTGAFTTARLEVLQLLSAQTAIAIENANLYANLEQKVYERTMEVRRKSRQMLDSIKYAKHIQEAILPVSESLSTRFHQGFVLYRPRDIVSGDFFWIARRGQKIYIAVVDCTGHGVPGGFLAMIGTMLLNQITREEAEGPHIILERLHAAVRETLNQASMSARTPDGMDTGLCCFDLEGGETSFAGAKINLYQVDPRARSEPRIRMIRGDRMSIGGRQREASRTFTTHRLALKPGSMIYLATDGYADQPDEKGHKYGRRRFRQLLRSIAGRSAETQREELLEELHRHMGEARQRDDITVLGVMPIPPGP